MPCSGYEGYFDSKLIISVATTGRHYGKEANPNLPLEPQEIARDVGDCEQAGVSIVHFHARADDGETTKDVERYQAI